MNLRLTKLIVFAILMENGKGIATKAPDYIIEKWNSVNLRDSTVSLLALLDDMNRHKYADWLAVWAKDTDDAKEISNV